jgi:hypothetical protein
VKIFFLFFSLWGYFISINAQLLQGEWRDHLPFHQFYQITAADNKIYASSVAGLLCYNKDNGEKYKITKAAGLKDFLSDVEISTINYSDENKILVIGYLNGNIDLMKEDGSIINLPDIKNKNITGLKRINKIVFNNSSAYLACEFGIVNLDLVKMEFAGNYYFGVGGTNIKVNDIAIANNFIYAATEEGIFQANINSPNLLDYNYWNHIDFIPQSEYQFVESFNNNLYAVYYNESSAKYNVISFSESGYEVKNFNTDNIINDLSSSNGFLCFSGKRTNTIIEKGEKIYSSFIFPNTNNILIDGNKTIFIATLDSAVQFQSINKWNKIYINSPEKNSVSKIETKGDHLWVSSGGPNNAYYQVGRLYYFNDDKWITYDRWDYPSIVSYANTYKIAIDPRNNKHVYVCSETYGIIEFLNGIAVRTYDRNNHSIFTNGLKPLYGVRAAGMQFDSQNNLWMVMSYSDNPIFKLNADSSWENPEVTNGWLKSGGEIFTDILVTKNNDIWISVNKKGLVVLRENGSGKFIEKSFAIKNQYGTVIDRPICMNEDHEGNIWIGTNVGPVIFYNPSQIFNDPDVLGYQVAIPRNDGTSNIDFLLSGETIFDIKTDGGNRKWIATEKSGVFLVSDDGKKTFYNFREDNSPLLSNNVTGIGIMENSGEVFFATDKGLISFKGIATKGFDNFENVYVYPNPVRQNFNGDITITGLIENTIVKITDINGNLVYETTSLGGQSVWNGRNFNGNRVGTGVYLVFLSTQNGSQSHVTKILFIH